MWYIVIGYGDGVTGHDIDWLVGCQDFIDGIGTVVLDIVFVNTIVVVSSVNITAVVFGIKPTIAFGTIILAIFFDDIIALAVFAPSMFPAVGFYTMFPLIAAFYTIAHIAFAGSNTAVPFNTVLAVIFHTTKPAASDTTNTTKIIFS